MPLFRTFRGEHRFSAENMSAYIDKQLTPREAARLERHLAVCKSCPADLATLRQAKLVLQRAPVLPVPRSFMLPASAQAQRAHYHGLNRAFTMLSSTTAVVALVLVVLVASDALFSYLGIPANGARKSAPFLASSAPSSGAADTQLAPAATTGGAAESYASSTEQPGVNEPTVESAVPPSSVPQPTQESVRVPSEPPQPTAATVSKLAAVPGSSPTDDTAGAASVEANTVDTAATPASKGLAVERSNSGTPAQSPVAPSATPVVLSPTVTPVEASPTPVTPSATETLIELTPTPAQVAAAVQDTVPQTEPTLAPGDESWTREPMWGIWRGVRIASYVLVGVLLILLAALLWTGYRRRL
jgi:anti-sigma factor RsiW